MTLSYWDETCSRLRLHLVVESCMEAQKGIQIMAPMFPNILEVLSEETDTFYIHNGLCAQAMLNPLIF